MYNGMYKKCSIWIEHGAPVRRAEHANEDSESILLNASKSQIRNSKPVSTKT
jgi:hypothetical protein